jgi:hypothetical protein
MSAAAIGADGVLVLAGARVFPLVLTKGPPPGRPAPSGRDGLAEVADAGIALVRTGIGDWNLRRLAAQLSAERALLDAVQAHGLHAWSWLGSAADLPARAAGQPPSPQERLLARLADGLQGHPALAAYKGIDEPANPFRGTKVLPPAGMTRAYTRLKAIDPSHPVVVIQAPLGTAARLARYRSTFDITGADIYPVSYPPGVHAGSANRDLSVVGDVTRKMVAAAGGKPVWTTLQVAWSGTVPSQVHPHVVPRFPSLHDERFMVYQAIVSGARGLVFFGGHLTQVASPADAEAGWNWTFWDRVLGPLVRELSSTAVHPALVAPAAHAAVRAGARDVQLVTRTDGTFLYVIAVRRGAATSLVTFRGLPRRHDGSPIGGGEALFEYVQRPLPPPLRTGRQAFRTVEAGGGSFRDWLGPHDARVYRFPL